MVQFALTSVVLYPWINAPCAWLEWCWCVRPQGGLEADFDLRVARVQGVRLEPGSGSDDTREPSASTRHSDAGFNYIGKLKHVRIHLELFPQFSPIFCGSECDIASTYVEKQF